MYTTVYYCVYTCILCILMYTTVYTHVYSVYNVYREVHSLCRPILLLIFKINLLWGT